MDIVNNQRVHDLILGFYNKKMPIGAICYGVARWSSRGTSTSASRSSWAKTSPAIALNTTTTTTPACGDELQHGAAAVHPGVHPLDAVGPTGAYHGNFGKRTSVIVDYPFITARSLQCAHEFGDRFVDVMTKGLTRSGWCVSSSRARWAGEQRRPSSHRR